MEIKNANLVFRKSMSSRVSTKRIILHHAAASSCSVQDVHSWHLARKDGEWAGIGYHFFVRKNGEIWQGRPIDKIGSHALGSNSDSIGVCFEGNFEKEHMSATQIKSGQEVLAYIKSKYGNLTVKRHKNVCATSCPGDNFPFYVITNTTDTSTNITTTNTGGLKNMTTLKKGAKGTEVEILQLLLNHHGANPTLDLDASFGTKTDTAVRAFQKAKGLAVDGSVGSATWTALQKTPTAVATACTKCAGLQAKITAAKTALA